MDMVVYTIILAPGRLGRRAAVAVSYPELHGKFTVHLGYITCHKQNKTSWRTVK